MFRGGCVGWGWVRRHRVDKQLDIDGVVMLGSGSKSGVVIETVSRSWCLSMRGMLCSIRNSLKTYSVSRGQPQCLASDLSLG